MIPFIKEAERDQPEWNRKAKDAVNALSRLVSQNGATAARPVSATVGQMFYDTTLGKPIFYHPTGVWKDAGGTTV